MASARQLANLLLSKPEQVGTDPGSLPMNGGTARVVFLI